jgi:hypothetical protein
MHNETLKIYNYEGCNSTSQILDLLSRDYQFEFHKSQGH